MSPFISTARAYLRFALGLRSYLHNTVTHDEAQATIRQQLLSREENFINTLKSNIFDYPRSPYLALFKAEYCIGDVVSIRREKPMVTSRGKYFPIRTLTIKP